MTPKAYFWYERQFHGGWGPVKSPNPPIRKVERKGPDRTEPRVLEGEVAGLSLDALVNLFPPPSGNRKGKS